MILTLSILPFSCIGAAIGVWPAVSVVSRMKPWPLGLLAGGGVLVGTAAAFGLLGLGLMLLFIPFFTGKLDPDSKGDDGCRSDLCLLAAF